MKVFLAVAGTLAPQYTAIPEFQDHARQDRFGVHQLADDPEAAELILFVDPHQLPYDWRLQAIRRHPLYLKYRSKTMVYDERDQTWCSLPGLYVSMPASVFDSRLQRACGYHKCLNTQMVKYNLEPDLLFSFMGSRSHKIRNAVLTLNHSRAYIEDTTHTNFFDFSDDAQHIQRKTAQAAHFNDMVNRSKFVLCPRGRGTSSIRMYEAMSVGRVPVVISDDWQPPIGPDWEQCILRVPESDVASLPMLLEAKEERYQEMARSADAIYKEWFAPDVIFHRLIEDCRTLLQSNEELTPRRFLLADGHYLRQGAYHWRLRVRQELVKIKHRVVR